MRRLALVAWLIAPFVLPGFSAAGTITGHGRFEKIAGNPGMGHKELYEWNLYLSPSDNSMVGPSRRLGAPPGQVSTGDGYYRIDGLPAGTYSVYINQPDFFASPKVVPNVVIPSSGELVLDVDLDVDYSTYFHPEVYQWTDWKPSLYQTFTAVGTSVRGVSWKMAGGGLYSGKTATVRILEDNGNANVQNWTLVAEATDSPISNDSDEWVRFTSGDVPMTPGKQYAVHVAVPDGLAMFKRDKDAQSYQGGQAYDDLGNPLNQDMCVTVFTDRGDIVTHTSKSSGAGVFDGDLSETRWGQTFVATGDGLAALDLFAASGMSDLELTWRILEDGPDGQQVGPTKTTQGAYFASSTDLVGVSFNPGEVDLIAGETYYIEAVQLAGFTPYLQQPWEEYGDGTAYRDGSPYAGDLSMTIVEYNLGLNPEPSTLVMLAGLLIGFFVVARRRG